MIVDLPRFVEAERVYWTELQVMLDWVQAEPERQMTLAEIERLHYLYERSSADLARLDTFATDPRLRAFVESLVSRAYGEIHETRARTFRLNWQVLAAVFPRAFRRHLGAFWLALAITLAGFAFGWFALRADARSKAVLMPFPGLMLSPAERVAQEEGSKTDRLQGQKASFSAGLMVHNIRMAFLTFASGVTWGAGPAILLFYNGVVLGAVAADYVSAGQSAFLAGWLLPHGAVEIPAILLAGQAAFLLAGALVGWGERVPRAARLRSAAPDLFAIAAGAAVLLVWAGIVEAFVSQYHQPVIPYGLKMAFGVFEMLALGLFLARAGRSEAGPR